MASDSFIIRPVGILALEAIVGKLSWMCALSPPAAAAPSYSLSAETLIYDPNRLRVASSKLTIIISIITLVASTCAFSCAMIDH